MNDAETLRRAAEILRARSSKPRSFWLAVVCKVLLSAAAKADARNGQQDGRKPTGETRPGDLRYNIMVRRGNLGCPHDVDGLDTEALRAHWHEHLESGGRPPMTPGAGGQQR
jgi:hypothetical protein